MTFQQLQYLLEIHRAGSVSKAAKALYVSQPSVSISLTALEDELGFPIFTRNQRGLVPTPEGKQAIDYAKRICNAHNLLINIKGSTKPVFRCSGTGYRPFNNAFARLAEECKDQDIRLLSHSISPTVTIQRLAACDLDVGILHTLSSWVQEIQAQIERHNLQSVILASIPISIHLGKAHPLCKRSEIIPQDLKGVKLIENSNQEISKSVYRGILPIDPESVIIAANSEIKRELISRGLGYAVGIPYSEKICQQYGIRNIPLQGYSYKVIVITNPAQQEKPETKRFIELLKEELERNDYWNV